MSREQAHPRSSVFNQIEVTKGPMPAASHAAKSAEHEPTWLLQAILAAQDRQNELLEELIDLLGAAHRQRARELGQWREAHPRLTRRCRAAMEIVGKLQLAFLDSLTRELTENGEGLSDSDFLLNELVDRYGPRLAHLNALLQVLSQLGGAAPAADTPDSPS
jgi:hypothetical protein